MKCTVDAGFSFDLRAVTAGDWRTLLISLLSGTGVFVSGSTDGGWQLGASIPSSESPRGGLESSVASRVV
jgi:hypothetical protein